MNILLVIFSVNMFLLCFGVLMSWLDIRLFGAGLYLALVSTVTVVIVLAFCLVGTDEQTEPTVAKQMWSKSRQTIRRYTAVRRNESNDLMLYNLQQADSNANSYKPTLMRYVLPPPNADSSPTPSISTNDPNTSDAYEEQKCVVQLHSDRSSSDSLPVDSYKNAVIYI